MISVRHRSNHFFIRSLIWHPRFRGYSWTYFEHLVLKLINDLGVLNQLGIGGGFLRRPRNWVVCLFIFWFGHGHRTWEKMGNWLVVSNINFIFPYIGNFIIPTDELIFFRGVGQPPTRSTWAILGEPAFRSGICSPCWMTPEGKHYIPISIPTIIPTRPHKSL